MPKLRTVIATTKKDGAKHLAPLIPEAIRVLFEPRPLTSFENPDDYDRVLAMIIQDVSPNDTFEWFWVKDIVDLAWEARRLRLFKVLLMRVSSRKTGGRLLAPILEPETPDYLPASKSENAISAYLSGDADAGTSVRNALDMLGLPEEALSTVAFVQSLPELEKIEQMLRSVEARRDAALRSIERSRFATGQRLRSASGAEVVDLKIAGRNDE